MKWRSVKVCAPLVQLVGDVASSVAVHCREHGDAGGLQPLSEMLAGAEVRLEEPAHGVAAVALRVNGEDIGDAGLIHQAGGAGCSEKPVHSADLLSVSRCAPWRDRSPGAPAAGASACGQRSGVANLRGMESAKSTSLCCAASRFFSTPARAAPGGSAVCEK